MAKTDLFTVLIFIENVFCVYRNFNGLSKFWRNVAVARVAAMLAVNAGASAELVATTAAPLLWAHSALTTGNSVLGVLAALRTARRFAGKRRALARLQRRCGADPRLARSLARLRRKVFAVIALLSLIYSITFVVSLHRWFRVSQNLTSFTVYSGLVHSLLSFWREMRFQFEFLTFNVFIQALILFMEHLDARLVRLRRALPAAAGAELRRRLDEWTAASGLVADCSAGIQDCFGVQITFSLFLLMMYVIGIGYDWVATIVSKAPGSAGPGALLLASYSLSVVLLCRAGQQQWAAARRLRTSLARLELAALAAAGPAAAGAAGAVRAARRAAAARRPSARAAGGATLGMGLLLAFCDAAVSYTIVLLQFGRVV